MKNILNKSTPKPTAPATPKDEAKPDVKPKPANPPKEEPKKTFKTCSKDFKEYPICGHLNGFKYHSRKQAIDVKGLAGLRGEKLENMNTFCGAYGTHQKFYPNKGHSTPRGKYGASLSSCQCCKNSSKGANLYIKWRVD